MRYHVMGRLGIDFEDLAEGTNRWKAVAKIIWSETIAFFAAYTTCS
jgi:hypothetical protein